MALSAVTRPSSAEKEEGTVYIDNNVCCGMPQMGGYDVYIELQAAQMPTHSNQV